MEPPRVPSGMAMGKWNLDSASTTTAGDEEAQGTGDSESHRPVVTAVQKGRGKGPSLRDRLLRMMASNEESLDRLKQLEEQFDALRRAFEALAVHVPPELSLEIATRFGLDWFKSGHSENAFELPLPTPSDDLKRCGWKISIAECRGLPRMRVFASPSLRLWVRLDNETLGTSWTSAEVPWSDHPVWEPSDDGVDCRPGDEVRLAVLSPDAVVGDSQLVTLEEGCGRTMEIPLWRHTVGDSALRLPSGTAVLLMVQAEAPSITAVFRLISIDDVALPSDDPPPSAVSVTFTVKSSGEARQLRLPHDPSIDAQPVELCLDSRAEEEQVIASLQVDGWGTVGVGEGTIHPSSTAEELAIELWRDDDYGVDLSSASDQDCVGVITVHVTYS